MLKEESDFKNCFSACFYIVSMSVFFLEIIVIFD